MQVQSRAFKSSARAALLDADLQKALGKARGGFVDKRAAAVQALPEFESLKDKALEIKNHTLAHLDFYLEQYEKKVIEAGGKVHWAQTAAEAREIVLAICAEAGGSKIIKGKSMVGEEIAINPALEAAGFDVIETDLGEYIIQLADEPPSHIIAPAVHKTKDQITALFQKHHRQYGFTAAQTEIGAIVNEARSVLRQAFVEADIGITGANFLVAETGSHVLVTNEGNGDLTSTLPRVHIVTTSIEKVVPSREDAMVMLRLLARSATGQEISNYQTFYTGCRRPTDLDGPEEFHVVLVDNGRSDMLDGEFHDMLRCIRCGACMNHCPVYGAIGGHAYGWVYPGPMGSVLTPLMVGLTEAADLPNACTLNGRCAEVCPMSIPLPTMLRRHRIRQFRQGLVKGRTRFGLGAWAWVAQRPRLYQALTGLVAGILARLAGKRGGFRSLPMAAAWTSSRDFPAPQGGTFVARAASRRGTKPSGESR